MNGKQVIAKLKAAGGSLSHITGSHPILHKDEALRDVPVPVHGTKDLGNGLVASIQRQTGVIFK
jgi:predicted RNA binding protein YcfA (HicA-like mRNA interferase family)